MAFIQRIYTSVFLLTVVFNCQIVPSEARPIKDTKKSVSQTIKSSQNLAPHKDVVQVPPPSPFQSQQFADSVGVFKDDFRPTSPENSPSVGHRFENEESPANGKGVSHAFAANKDDFRPTSPGNSPGVGHQFSPTGNSPGVGHPFAHEKELANRGEERHSLAATKDDFRPTSPGNSPGVGHQFAPEQKTLANGKNASHSTAENKDDFRSTNPGHSPGVGHSFPNKIAEPNL